MTQKLESEYPLFRYNPDLPNDQNVTSKYAQCKDKLTEYYLYTFPRECAAFYEGYKFLPLPVYHLEKVYSYQNYKANYTSDWICTITLHNNIKITGEAKSSRKEAEWYTAFLALNYLENNNQRLSRTCCVDRPITNYYGWIR
jgi:hypothetical protein